MMEIEIIIQQNFTPVIQIVKKANIWAFKFKFPFKSWLNLLLKVTCAYDIIFCYRVIKNKLHKLNCHFLNFVTFPPKKDSVFLYTKFNLTQYFDKNYTFEDLLEFCKFWQIISATLEVFCFHFTFTNMEEVIQNCRCFKYLKS